MNLWSLLRQRFGGQAPAAKPHWRPGSGPRPDALILALNSMAVGEKRSWPCTYQDHRPAPYLGCIGSLRAYAEAGAAGFHHVQIYCENQTLYVTRLG